MTDRVEMPYEVSGSMGPEEQEVQYNQGDEQDKSLVQERPEWLPEKFKSPEDLAKAYQELEKKQGGQQNNKEDLGIPRDNEGDSTIEEVVENTGFSLDEMSQAFYEEGDLRPEHYEAIEKQGFPRAYVDQYIQGLKATATLAAQEAHNAAGGKDAYDAMTQWASKNFTEAEMVAYDKAIYSNDPETRKLAIQGLKSRYSSEYGGPDNNIRGGVPSSGDVFRSNQEMLAAMNDPRYDSDPAYRQEVYEKARNSSVYNRTKL